SCMAMSTGDMEYPKGNPRTGGELSRDGPQADGTSCVRTAECEPAARVTREVPRLASCWPGAGLTHRESRGHQSHRCSRSGVSETIERARSGAKLAPIPAPPDRTTHLLRSRTQKGRGANLRGQPPSGACPVQAL